VNVPDERLAKISELIDTEKVIPAAVEFVDIAGLVAGASKGEGLGNRFLSHIRETGIIAHVVRCFEDPDVVHVSGAVDPVSDIETIDVELALADLETVDKRLERLERDLRHNDRDVAKRAQAARPVLERIRGVLEHGRAARTIELEEEHERLIRDLHLITRKQQLFVCNVDESDLSGEADLVADVRARAEKEGAAVVVLCGKIEAEIAGLEDEGERQEFLRDIGIPESGLDRLSKEAYSLLGLRTFFTAGPKEVRAWTIRRGAKAPQAAGTIHTDFERGFIRAETYHCTDLFALGSEQKVKEAGKLRQEGKEYVVQDGDVMHFKFNV
jgi:hypothetical protein